MVAGGVIAWILRRRPWAAVIPGAGLLAAGVLSALVLQIFGYINVGGFSPRDIFVFPVLLLGLAAAMHSVGYLAGHGEERSGSYWFFFNLTIAAMLAVISAETPLEFLLAWEIMGAASFALVIFDRDHGNVCRAGWIYLIACHGGAGLLILLFTFSFAPEWVFVLSLLGFGLKIGFPLLHVWLPEAHPAAPAPVSAVMSGSMIELGFYGILAFGVINGGNYALYGWVFTLLGIFTMLPGIIYAVAQNNLKRLLAYSSIENMGILSCGLGLGFLGLSSGQPEMMIGGFVGAALHLLNHAFFKGGLFLGAGSVYKAAGTLDMDKMGGLLRRMPWTGSTFILHALGLCGLPPFAGFAGEFLIYSAAFAGLSGTSTGVTTVSTAVLVTLALTGGLAAAAFAKVIGAVFCGEPRTGEAAGSREVSPGMILPLIILFIFSCLLLVFSPQLVEYAVVLMVPEYWAAALKITGKLQMVVAFSIIGTGLTVLLLIIRIILTRRYGERHSATWDCGYALPTARMEYTGTSFSQCLVDFFGAVLHPVRRIVRPQGVFPEKAALTEEVADGGIARFWKPLFRICNRAADRVHALQSGSLHFYLLVLVLTMMGMLVGAVLSGD